MLFASMSAKDCHLQYERIDIWEFGLENLPDSASSFLAADELARAQRFHFPRHQRRFTIARAMLRVVLGHYLQQNARELTFTYNQHGKPQVINACNLQFNLSHSGELALLAIGQQFPLGIDLEFFSARPYEGIAKHSFSSKESACFSTLPGYLKVLAFFHVWAQKEALIKACGLGLAYPIQQFDVPVLPPTDELVADELHKTHWKMTSFMPTAGCCAALCYAPHIREIRYIRADALEFL